jgi:hypothetical protein
MTTATQTSAAAATQADGAPGRCRYPGCASPARGKDPAAPGPRPGYCEQEVPEDRGDGTPVLVRHTAMTAFRRRGQFAGQPGGDRPVRAAAAQAITAADDQAAARQHAEQRTRAADRALHDEREAAAAQIAEADQAAAAARAERDAVVAATGQARADAARAREQDQQRHAAELAAAAAQLAAATAQLAAANDTIAALRDQLTRTETALDRERAEQHKTVSLLHDLLASRPAPPAGSGGHQPHADGSTGHRPAETAGNGTSRRQPR